MKTPSSISVFLLMLSLVAMPAFAQVQPLAKPMVPKGSLANLPDPKSLITGKQEARVPEIQRFELANGLKVLYLQDKTVPVFSGVLAMKAGGLEDAKDKEGLASMTAKLLRAGGTDRVFWSQQDESLESRGASVEFQATKEYTSASIHCFDRDAGVVLEQVAGMLETPSFYAPRVEFVRGQMLADVKQVEDQPIQLALRSFQALLFEGGSFGRFPTETSLKAITHEDITSFAKTWYHPDQAVLAVSCSLDLESTKKLLTQALGQWRRGTGTSPVRGAHKSWAKPGLYLRPKTGLTQSTVLAGMPWLREDDPDSVALNAALNVLGESGLTSRIFNSVRTREGLAYAAGSFHLDAVSTDGAFMAYALTKAESTAKAATLLKAEVERMVKDGLTQEELDDTKRSLSQKALFDSVTTADILDRAAQLELFGRPQDTYVKRLEKLQALTLAEVHGAIKRHLKSSELRVFALADPKAAQLDQLGPVTQVK